MNGAKGFMTLSFIQDWTATYNSGENIGLVATDASKANVLGVFLLDTTRGGYQQDVVVSDGPIIYGTGMNEVDRQNAWKHVVLQISEACYKQQGKDAASVKISRRCLPGQDYCSQIIDASFIGIGGIQEPRKVQLMIATDVHDQNKQLSRIICTYPAKATRVCRDWDTGKLIGDDTGQ